MEIKLSEEVKDLIKERMVLRTGTGAFFKTFDTISSLTPELKIMMSRIVEITNILEREMPPPQYTIIKVRRTEYFVDWLHDEKGNYWFRELRLNELKKRITNWNELFPE